MCILNRLNKGLIKFNRNDVLNQFYIKKIWL